MFEKYKDRVEFLLVYIREAHATDGWQVPRNVKEGILLENAKTMEQKEEHATSCARKLDIKFPTLLDGMDNKVELAYTAWPDRLYLVDKNGRIAYKSKPGPGGFKPVELEAAIRQELGLD
ncbi:MAG: deiodinase [Acidobacteria bacterium]|nr:deiodinase [Acidobacteriota bacterium]